MRPFLDQLMSMLVDAAANRMSQELRKIQKVITQQEDPPPHRESKTIEAEFEIIKPKRRKRS